MQGGLHAANTIKRRLDGKDAVAFKYRDLGSAAAIGRFNAIVSVRGLRLSGFPGWVVWMFVHLAFLNGFGHRAATMFRWLRAMIGRARPERVFSVGHTGGDLSLPDEVKAKVMPKPFPLLEDEGCVGRLEHQSPTTSNIPKLHATSEHRGLNSSAPDDLSTEHAGSSHGRPPVPAATFARMILDKFLVTDQVAVVTASGRGIGAAAAVALAEAGADVVLAARTEEQLREVAKKVEATGRRAIVVPGDLTDFDLMASLAERAHSELGRLDIVVNNMGGTMPRPLLDTSPRFLEEAFRFNVSAGHALIRAAVPIMLEGDHPGGAIVSISSVMGHVGGRGYLGYGTVKGALEQYTRLASRDLAPRIRVNAVGVGSTATSALDIVMSSDELRTTMERVDAARSHRPCRRHRGGNPVPGLPAGSYVTGKVLEVDGGLQSPNLEMPIPDL